MIRLPTVGTGSLSEQGLGREEQVATIDPEGVVVQKVVSVDSGKRLENMFNYSLLLLPMGFITCVKSRSWTGA